MFTLLRFLISFLFTTVIEFCNEEAEHETNQDKKTPASEQVYYGPKSIDNTISEKLKKVGIEKAITEGPSDTSDDKPDFMMVTLYFNGSVNREINFKCFGENHHLISETNILVKVKNKGEKHYSLPLANDIDGWKINTIEIN